MTAERRGQNEVFGRNFSNFSTLAILMACASENPYHPCWNVKRSLAHRRGFLHPRAAGRCGHRTHQGFGEPTAAAEHGRREATCHRPARVVHLIGVYPIVKMLFIHVYSQLSYM